MESAALIDRHQRMQLTAEESDALDETLRRAVVTLWQANLLGRGKLTVLAPAHGRVPILCGATGALKIVQ